MKCERCGEEKSAFTMSFFNTDTICMGCQELETTHPAYEYARRKENEEVLRGNFNYPGIGLPEGYDEWAKLAKTSSTTPG